MIFLVLIRIQIKYVHWLHPPDAHIASLNSLPAHSLRTPPDTSHTSLPSAMYNFRTSSRYETALCHFSILSAVAHCSRPCLAASMPIRCVCPYDYPPHRL